MKVGAEQQIPASPFEDFLQAREEIYHMVDDNPNGLFSLELRILYLMFAIGSYGIGLEKEDECRARIARIKYPSDINLWGDFLEFQKIATWIENGTITLINAIDRLSNLFNKRVNKQ